MEFFGQSYCTSGECSEQFTDDRQRMLHIIIISSPKKVTPAKDWIRSTSFFSPSTLNSKHARMLNVNANWFSFERKVNLGNRLDWRETEKVAFISLISLSGVYEGKRIDQIRVNGPLVVESNNLVICRRKMKALVDSSADFKLGPKALKFLIKMRCW